MSEQSIITDYTRTWLRSFSDADSIAETAHSADIRNAATKDKELESLVNFSKSLDKRFEERRQVKEQYDKGLETWDYTMGKELEDHISEDIQAGANIEGVANNQDQESNNLAEKVREVGGTNSEVNDTQLKNSAAPLHITKLKVKLAVGELNTHLNEILEDPNRQWQMPGGPVFTKNTGNATQLEWRRKEAIIEYFRNNKHINLTKVNKILLLPYAEALRTSFNTGLKSELNALSDKNGATTRATQLELAIANKEFNSYLEAAAITTVNGVPLGRSGAITQLMTDLETAVTIKKENGDPLITYEQAWELLNKAVISWRFKGAGKTLAQEWPTKFGTDSVEALAFQKKLEAAWTSSENADTKFHKARLDEKVQDFLDNCSHDYSDKCTVLFSAVEKEAQKYEGYTNSSLTAWQSRKESQPSNDAISQIEAQLDSALKHNWLAPGTTIGLHKIEDLINMLPVDKRKTYQDAIKNREHLLNADFKRLKPGEGLVRNITKQLGESGKLVGTQERVAIELDELYTRKYEDYLAASDGSIKAQNDAAWDANIDVTEWFNANTGKGKRYELGVQRDKYAQFVNEDFLKGSEVAIDIKKTANDEKDVELVKIENIRTQVGKHGKEAILNSSTKIIATDDQIKEFQERFNKDPKYLIPSWLREASQALKENPIYIANRLLKARNMDLVNDPVSTAFYERVTPKTRSKLMTNPTNFNSSKVVYEMNKDGLDTNTIPFNQSLDDLSVPEENKGMVAALIDTTNRGDPTKLGDLKGAIEILNMLGDDPFGASAALEAAGIDLQELKQEMFKYTPKKDRTLAWYPFRTSLSIGATE